MKPPPVLSRDPTLSWYRHIVLTALAAGLSCGNLALAIMTESSNPIFLVCIAYSMYCQKRLNLGQLPRGVLKTLPKQYAANAVQLVLTIHLHVTFAATCLAMMLLYTAYADSAEGLALIETAAIATTYTAYHAHRRLMLLIAPKSSLPPTYTPNS